MRTFKVLASVLAATILLSSTTAFAAVGTPKASIITSKQTFQSHVKTTNKRAIWDFPDGGYDDDYTFSSHITYRNKSSHVIYVNVLFPEQGIESDGTLYPGEPISDITTNFDFGTVIVTLVDYRGYEFYSEEVSTYSSHLVIDGRHHPKVL